MRPGENASAASGERDMERTRNLIVRLVMETIRHDSLMHYQV